MQQNAMGGLTQPAMAGEGAVTSHRSTAPVFVLGCPRSGTTLLYHMLLSAGNFAVYRAESNVFNLLMPGFGSLRQRRDRERLLRVWLRSKLFTLSGLDADEISTRIIEECRNAGDFLRILMESIARRQKVERWADCTPDHLLYIPEIKRQIPNALIVHIIRDGRDVALSYAKQGWSYPLPWDRGQSLGVAALYWDWMVRRGRQHGQHLGSDYCEVHFEDLVRKPSETLSRLSLFVGQELDLEEIKKKGIGSVSEPNSSFLTESAGDGFNPVERWRDKLESNQVSLLEGLVGDLLRDLEYPISDEAVASVELLRMRMTYRAMFTAKLWLRSNMPLARYLIDLSRMEIKKD